MESHLHTHLAEHLNSEIALRTITDLEVAKHWIKSTFLYVRAIKNPTNYGFAAGSKENIENELKGKNSLTYSIHILYIARSLAFSHKFN